ncbi:MAG: hypothetical protein M3419_05315 [Actinomycetota bacterium]|nr:hypothetical protein [Actinomycetota bacterium]
MDGIGLAGWLYFFLVFHGHILFGAIVITLLVWSLARRVLAARRRVDDRRDADDTPSSA